MSRKIKTVIAIIAMALALTACEGDTDPCNAQPNPDKRAICQEA